MVGVARRRLANGDEVRSPRRIARTIFASANARDGANADAGRRESSDSRRRKPLRNGLGLETTCAAGCFSCEGLSATVPSPAEFGKTTGLGPAKPQQSFSLGNIGGILESLRLPQWSLTLRLEGDTLAVTLGDGKRLAISSRQPAAAAQLAQTSAAGAGVLGDEIADRLARSAPRPLSILYEAGTLDAIDWEHLELAGTALAEQFAVGRQLLTDSDVVAPAPGLTDTLSVSLILDHSAARLGEPALFRRDLVQPPQRDLAAGAQVLVLDDVSLPQLLDDLPLPVRSRLIVTSKAPPVDALCRALDSGAAVIVLADPADLGGEPVATLLQQLRQAASVGEALRWLHRRASPGRFAARLYGDPDLRFVRPQPPTSRRQVTSLWFDLVGSTALIARLGDEAYADTLATVHERCAQILRRHGGQPDNPQGNDGLMAYFGHPVAIENAAVRAVEAGLGIVAAVRELGLAVRVGIATGWVAVKFGQPVGLSIHLAARLQQVAGPGTVLVSDATRRLVEHAFDLRPIAQRPALKGIDDHEKLFAVVGPRGGEPADRLAQMPTLTPLLAREQEIDRLHAAWRRVSRPATVDSAAADTAGTATAPTSRLAVVRGEAGMGKSRLVREFRRQLEDGGTQVLECRCRADASASPFLSLAEALRRWIGLDAAGDRAEAESKIAAALPRAARNHDTLLLLTDLLGLSVQPPAEAASARPRLIALLIDWLESIARKRPCCLLIEDWHWADPSLRELIEILLQRSSTAALLVVITERSEAGIVPISAAPLVRIELTGLPTQAARQLVEHVAAGASLSPRLIEQLAARGDGVPLFIEEAARMALTLGAGGDSAGSDTQTLEQLPATLHDLLGARLDGLGTAKQLAQIAAVLGRQFPRDLLAALVEASGYALDDEALADRLAELIGSGLVRREGAGRFAFRHALIRDAAYNSLWIRDRQMLHRRVVELLRARWPEVAAQQPELLAQHLTEAGQHAEALIQWELAGRRAAARSAQLEAISHLQRALAVLARLEPAAERDRVALRLQLLLAAQLLATEGYGADAVLAAYREAEHLCDKLGDDTARFKVEMGLNAYHFMRADFANALDHGQRAAAIALRSNDVKQRLQAHWSQACVLFHQGRLRATLREMETALALYVPAMHAQFGLQDPGIMCMAYSSWGLWERGQPDAALARITQAVSIADAYQHRFSQAVALSYAVSVELLRGDTAAALTRADRCADVCDTHGFPVWLAITRCMRGYLQCELGQYDGGLAEMQAGYAQWLGTGARVSQPLYLALQAEGLMLAGDLDTATARVDEGLAIVEHLGERQLEAELTRLRGVLLLRRGAAAEGEAWLRRAHARALRQHRLGFALRSATDLARHWTSQGRHEAALRLLAPLAARWHEGHDTRDVKAAMALLQTLAPSSPHSTTGTAPALAAPD